MDSNNRRFCCDGRQDNEKHSEAGGRVAWNPCPDARPDRESKFPRTSCSFANGDGMFNSVVEPETPRCWFLHTQASEVDQQLLPSSLKMPPNTSPFLIPVPPG